MTNRFSLVALCALGGVLPLACSSSGDLTSTTTNTEVSIPPTGVVITDAQAATLVGKTEVAAKAQAESSGWVWRIGSRDGEQFALTMDYCQCRVTVAINNDIVTDAVVG